MKKIFIILFLINLFAVCVYSQNFHEKVNHPFAGKAKLTLQLGPTFSDTDYEGWGTDVFGGLSLDYLFPSKSRHAFGINFFADLGYLSGTDNRFEPRSFRTDIYTLGGGFVYSYYLSERIVPRFFAGMSYIWYDPRDMSVKRNYINGVNTGDLKEFNYNAEIGFSYILSEEFSLNLGFGLRVTPNDHLDGMEIPYTNKDLFYTGSFGISYAFQFEPDTDGDGIADLEDICPNTPNGVLVNQYGCTVDNDLDGIADHLDQCPNTKPYSKVNEKGCPTDSDYNGDSDYLKRLSSNQNKSLVNHGYLTRADNLLQNDYANQNEDNFPSVSQGKFTATLNSDNSSNANFRNSEQVNISEVIKYDFYNEKILDSHIYTDGRIYCIQHSSWRTYNKANEVVKSLGREGHRAFIQETYIPAQDEFRYRVRIGYFKSFEAAVNYTQWLQ